MRHVLTPIALSLALTAGTAAAQPAGTAAAPPATKPAAKAAAAVPAAPAATNSTSAASGPRAEQQARMKACNAKARENALKGDARRAFMKTCLKKS
jgi:hypothetical protein